MEDLPTTAGNDILVENAGGGVMFKEIGDERKRLCPHMPQNDIQM